MTGQTTALTSCSLGDLRAAARRAFAAGKRDTYWTALEMVSNRHSKGALVELVNWLLKGQP
jgi:hypothetical protein